jgi:centromeric protein E
MKSVDTEYVIKLTFAELYNEEFKDLLTSSTSSSENNSNNLNLKIVDDPNLGPLIQNITEASFTSADEMKKVLRDGENKRHFGVTNMNMHSSRSHVIVRLCIESRKVSSKPYHPLRPSWGNDRPTCVSTLNLVDLAGSENAAKSGTKGQSLKEGSYINKSLLTLGTVIANLSEGKSQHIPYRNSKLTRLLSAALGGNAKTCVIACVSPASGNIMETLSTLRFASRAKRIVNIVHKNVILDAKAIASKLAIQNKEIDGLKKELDLSRQLSFSITVKTTKYLRAL